MKTFKTYIKENFDLDLPKGEINGSWFGENGLPMIVSCTCCGSTMCSVSALIDDEGYTFCSSCVGDYDG